MTLNNPLLIENVFSKIEALKELNKLKSHPNWSILDVPEKTSRDVEVVMASKMPKKKGLSFKEGKQRLLHDLASIELQAFELGLRTLIEFYGDSNIPEEFFNELIEITLEESFHLSLCLKALEEYGGFWGMFPVHLGLWQVASDKDSINERVLKVHRYLEGSGLDATFSLLNRVKQVPDSQILEKVISRIAHDEIKHVKFGSYWFSYFCKQDNLSNVSECKRILEKYYHLLPRRKERMSVSLRTQAGFSLDEIKVFSSHQQAKLVEE